ncbi:MAG: nucleoside phosphorylase [Saprospiraceae bacterium]|nr:nucleoside phosphorylase [Saprospiraceae bacterium]
MKLKESELILNKNGSIYHLQLFPEQVAPTVLTVGDPDRVRMVSRYFDRIDHKVRHREFVTHTGWLGKTHLTVISTGIGTDNIDIVLNELDALVNLDLESRSALTRLTTLNIIRLGTSGSIQPELGVDSLLMSNAAFGMDGLLRYYHAPGLVDNEWVGALTAHAGDIRTLPALPYYAPADPGLVNIFSERFQPGLTATSTGFYAPQGRQIRATSAVPELLQTLQAFAFKGKKITNLEMETSAIYGLSGILGHRAISLNAILANRATGTFSKHPERVVKRLIETALEKLSERI